MYCVGGRTRLRIQYFKLTTITKCTFAKTEIKRWSLPCTRYARTHFLYCVSGFVPSGHRFVIFYTQFCYVSYMFVVDCQKVRFLLKLGVFSIVGNFVLKRHCDLFILSLSGVMSNCGYI